MQASLTVVYATQLIERSEGFRENQDWLPDGNYAFSGLCERPADHQQHNGRWRHPFRGWLQPPSPQQTASNHTGTPVAYSDYIRQAASNYGVDENLIKAIIQVESGFNPLAVSKSNAVGLMQLKASTAGRDAYRMKGRRGQPSSRELKDPAVNIDLGAAYINILQAQLAGSTIRKRGNTPPSSLTPTVRALCCVRFPRIGAWRSTALIS
ncbi:Endo-type membrane-bound lytic murein transglycosylase A precursor [Serratia rubidaea]|uniref:peptidoglycan lytic exotransglycosylase n=1 Tax=Serratia rubidaea TaxID=61652 RepID=A0A447QTI5_SERRU|nr:Endo-type membrane-bound lytic murein transglycosylase A precursor [Serratia rubidaea]